jgi:hypothetical protein
LRILHAGQPAGENLHVGSKSCGSPTEKQGRCGREPEAQGALAGPFATNPGRNAGQLGGGKRLRLVQGTDDLAGGPFGQTGLVQVIFPAGRIKKKATHDFPFFVICS